jgi:hypothetical protein
MRSGQNIKMFWVSWDAEWNLGVICVAKVSKNLLDPEICYEMISDPGSKNSGTGSKK